jgi:hypothetical protein
MIGEVLSGKHLAYQAPRPFEKNDLSNNVTAYYFPENMKTMGWHGVTAAGGPGGLMFGYYHESGYFLNVYLRVDEDEQKKSVWLWISDETTVVPVLSTTQN